MPTTTRDGVVLRYETAGEGPPVVFVGDAGLGVWTWGWQTNALAGPYTTVTVDCRGGAHSDAPPGPYTVGDLVADLRAVVRDAALGGRPHLVGLGLGGAVALAYARAHPVGSLCLLGTPPDAGATDRGAYERALADPADEAALADSLAHLLSADFRERHPDVCDAVVEWRAADDARRAGRAAQLAALADVDATGWLHEVTAPALVCHGGADALVPPPAGERLADALPRGEHRRFPGAGHLVGVERSRPVNDALEGFLGDDGRGR
ncbi:MAG: alpha/beta fold hydrolase [Halobacteriaceae archaeon]